ncbi:acidic leucine-rich nuclear phosphoprotein 32 family member B-like [Epinephelus moara]|uniref:acidic leucine-rich nuclear phosphoprotein 32 family member B-like n=1 Tax=Epinephelus moara TaxID=300413 RepID=UPI00214EEBD1|nr:acidic leucine-rich nuclear phosphoprotein 32 family member B-like [Epinephelus moara]
MGDWLARKIGDMVEDKVRGALGMEEKEEDKEKGFFSKVLGRDDDEDDKKGKRDKDDKEEGFFSRIFDRDNDDDKWREMQKDKDDEDKGFFSKVFDRDHDDDDDDDKWKEKKSGFAGLFREQGGPGAAGGVPGENVGGGEDGGGVKGQSAAVNDGDLFNDLMNVAEETSKGD